MPRLRRGIESDVVAPTLDAHHNQGRFTWELGPAGDEAPIVGFDVA